MKIINCPENRVVYIAESTKDYLAVSSMVLAAKFPAEDNIDWSKKDSLVVFFGGEREKADYYRCAYRPSLEQYVFLDAKDNPRWTSETLLRNALIAGKGGRIPYICSDSEWQLHSK